MPKFDTGLATQDGLGFVGRIYKHLADKLTLTPERSTDNVLQAQTATAVPFVVRRFSSGATSDLLQIQDETGAVLGGFGSSGSALGGSIASNAYRLVSDGTTVTAYDKTGNAVSSGTDGGAVLTAVLPAAASVGATIEFRNDGNAFPWATVPGLPAGITSKLLIRGNGSKIVLSAAAPRFLDLNRTADYVTFQHIEVTDFVIDASLRGDTTTHTIIGTMSSVAAASQRVNLLDITVRRVRCFGVPTVHSAGIYFNVIQLAGGEGTQNTIKDILIEDVTIDGGVAGFVITGAVSPFDATVTNLNVAYDNIRIIRCKQTQSGGAVVGTTGTAACIEIGQNAQGGNVIVRDFYGEYSGDVGVEIDNAAKADVENVTISNTLNAYLITNFAAPVKPDAQAYRYSRCNVLLTDAAVAATARGFTFSVHNSIAFGRIFFDRCDYYNDTNTITTGSGPIMFLVSGAVVAKRMTIDGCSMVVDSVNWNNAANSGTLAGVFFTGGSGGGSITNTIIRNFAIKVAGQISGVGNVKFRGLNIENFAFSTNLSIDGFDIDYNITGEGAASATYGILLNPGAASTIGGSIQRMHLANLGSDSGSNGIFVGSTTNLTISPGPLLIQDCDWSQITTGGNEVNPHATQVALGAVVTIGNRWKTKPAPVALTGLATATGKILGAQSNKVIWPALVQLTQGSGSAITAVDYSTNGGTTYTNLLTQASGALPAGPGQNVGPLMPADLIKATFTTTQPTITLVPVNP